MSNDVERLLADNDGMVWQIAHHWHRTNPMLDLEDLHAEVRMGFVEAARRFDPGRGMKFATFAGHWGHNRARLYARRELAMGMHVPQHHGIVRVLVGRVDAPDGEGGECRGVLAVDREREKRVELPLDFWEKVAGVLPARDAEAVELRFRRGWKLDRIAERMGVCKERIRQRLLRALQVLRRDRAGLKAYLEE